MPHSPQQPASPQLGTPPFVDAGTGLPRTVESRFRHFAMAAGAFVVVVSLALGAFFVVTQGKVAHSLTVTLQPLGARGSNPFTASVATISDSAAQKFAIGRNPRHTSSPPPRTGSASQITVQSLSGSHRGFYGVDTATPVCDTKRLLTYLLTQNADKRQWASAMNIAVSDISSTVKMLTPMLLGADTLVTSYERATGSAKAGQVLLQAGTPVLVDGFGTPRVQCANGNPLAKPPVTSSSVTFTGHPWSTFDPNHVASIEPSPKPVETIEGIDIQSGRPTTIGVGGNVSLNGYLVKTTTGVSVVSFDGKTTTQVIDHPVAAAFDDGAGGIVYQDLRKATYGSVAAANDLIDTAPTSVDQGAVWHLTAGATTPVIVAKSTDLNSYWLALQGVGSLKGEPMFAYEHVPAPATQVTQASMHVVSLATGKDLQASSDFAVGEYPSGVEMGGSLGMFSVSGGQDPPEWHFFDETLHDASQRVGSQILPENSPFSGAVITPDGQVIEVDLSSPNQQPTLRITANSGTGPVTTHPINTPTSLDSACTPTNATSTSVLLHCFTGESGHTSAALVNLSTGDALSVEVDGFPRLLHAPIVRPGNNSETSASPPPTSSAPPTTISSTIPVQECDTTIETDGIGPKPAPPSVTLQKPLASITDPALYADSQLSAALVAPAGWTCTAEIGGDGSTIMGVTPPGQTASTSGGSNGIYLYDASACSGCQFTAVCAYFTNFPADLASSYGGCSDTVPSGESVDQIDPQHVTLSASPGVTGTGQQLSMPFLGAVFYIPEDPNNQTQQGGAGTFGCFLPASQSGVCADSRAAYLSSNGRGAAYGLN